jgi:hypothetical protein
MSLPLTVPTDIWSFAVAIVLAKQTAVSTLHPTRRNIGVKRAFKPESK